MRLAALPVVLAIGGCAATVPDYEFADDFEQRYDDVETRLALAPTGLRPGDVSKLVLTLSNVGASYMQLQFPERRQIGLAIFEESGGLWFTDVDTIKVPRFVGLAALQSWSYEIEWDGAVEMAGEREPLPPGRYEVQVGLRRSGDVFVNRSNRVAIEIFGS
jgi:hypothetical protein